MRNRIKILISILLSAASLLTFVTLSSCAGNPKENKPSEEEEEKEPTITEKIEALYASGVSTTEQIKELRSLVWQEYAEKVASEEPGRADELKKNKVTYITIGRTKMKVRTVVVGKAPEGGYPLFLVYHGGGYDPNDQHNEEQWSGMGTRYTQTGVAGIYVAIRSVSDHEVTGQIFSTDISWKFYDRIIADAILYMKANPDKVYIVGYSAGGDGVYRIAPAMADRLAAATMTAGHPGDTDAINLFNLPFYLNGAELDDAYNRNVETVKYAQRLDALSKRFNGGFEHWTFLHYNKEHGVIGDNAKTKQSVIKDINAWLEAYNSGVKYTGGNKSVTTDAATLMTEHTRDPIPARVLWNVQASRTKIRKDNCFYWLSCDAEEGVIDASYDRETNTVTIASVSKKVISQFKVYLNEDMVDLSKEVTVILPSGKKITAKPEISLDLLRSTTAKRGDPSYQFCASITVEP